MQIFGIIGKKITTRGVIHLAFLLSSISVAESQAITVFDHSHEAWNKIVKDYVVVQGPQSFVNYKALKKEPDSLKKYLNSIERVSKKDFQIFNNKQKLAFLINAYNAFTIKLILDHYPVKSIKDIGGFFSSPWKKKFFTLFGEKTHLDHIEHDLIRKQFNEPRIHFALVCASKGCPPLMNEAFIALKLDDQLERAAKTFLNDPQRNYFDSSSNTLYLSNIFKWYGEDFKKYGSVRSFVSSIIGKSEAEKKKIQNEKVKNSYLDYDWTLNEPPVSKEL